MSLTLKPAGATVSGTDQLLDDGRPPEFKIAIVGGGPRGLYALDAILTQLRSVGGVRRQLKIVLFEPAEFPGAGVVYHPQQPHHLRMNFANQYISAWVATSGETCPHAVQGRPSLLQWLQRHYPSLAVPTGQIARAIVGEYLHWCFKEVVKQFDSLSDVGSSADSILNFSIKKTTVSDVQRSSDRWKLSSNFGDEVFDHVLVTTGHGGWRSSGVVAPIGRGDASSLIDRVFPVELMLSRDRVPARSKVAVCGFSLTFIDTALSLTEGRGGQFERQSRGWVYRAEGSEPKVIFPFSRSGRPMLAKPDESAINLPSGLSALWEQGRQEVRAIGSAEGGVDFMVSVWPRVLHYAEEALLLCGAGDDKGREQDRRVEDWFNVWSTSLPSGGDAHRAMQQSWQVATGESQPDQGWALGEAWRQLYSALVDVLSHGRLREVCWPSFTSIATEMERIAFGPPAENLGRILALIDAGFVDLNYLRGDIAVETSGPCIRTDDSRHDVNVIVDAVIPATGNHPSDSIVGKLFNRRVLHPMPGTTAVWVDESGSALSKTGEVVGGLSVLGRSTEGCIVGNDTLSRKLHGHPQRWASRVLNAVLSECD